MLTRREVLTTGSLVVGAMCLVDEVKERIIACTSSQRFFIQQPQNASWH